MAEGNFENIKIRRSFVAQNLLAYTLALPLHINGPNIYLTVLNFVIAPPYRSDFTGSDFLSVKIPLSIRSDPIVSQLQTGSAFGAVAQIPSKEHWQPVSEAFREPLQ